MGWMDLVNDHRVFLVRVISDIWAEIEHGTLKSLDLLRPGLTERRPEFRYGEVLLLYRPQLPAPNAPPAELSHVVNVRSEFSNASGYGLGPLLRMVPSLGRESLLFASQRGSLPEVFRRADDRTFTLSPLTSEERDRFVRYVVNAGVRLQVEEGRGGPAVTAASAEGSGIVEFDW